MAELHIRQACKLVQQSSYTVVLTGAGLSTPSGIPDFRSPSSGLWNLLNPMIAASIWGFHDNPERFYRWFTPLARKIHAARPNAAHWALAYLEQAGLVQLLVTQNIDGLHQQAGSTGVVELHGHLRSATCLSCRQQCTADDVWPQVEAGEIVTCVACGGLVKPDAILFGEPLVYEHLKLAQEAALRCDVLIAAGSSLEVEPAADLPHLAKRRGARIILINHQPTVADSVADVLIREDVASVLPQLTETCCVFA
jgi:NAD-dependent deacetylase